MVLGLKKHPVFDIEVTLRNFSRNELDHLKSLKTDKNKQDEVDDIDDKDEIDDMQEIERMVQSMKESLEKDMEQEDKGFSIVFTVKVSNKTNGKEILLDIAYDDVFELKRVELVNDKHNFDRLKGRAVNQDIIEFLAEIGLTRDVVNNLIDLSIENEKEVYYSWLNDKIDFLNGQQ